MPKKIKSKFILRGIIYVLVILAIVWFVGYCVYVGGHLE